MDYLQYKGLTDIQVAAILGFKPYYKWITFNIDDRVRPEHAEREGF